MTADAIDAVAADWRPSARDDRAAIHAAIQTTAAINGGEVHISDVRQHLKRDVDPHMPGAVIRQLVKAGVLKGTGTYRANGLSSSRNRTKLAEVRLLVAPLPEDT